MKSFQDRVAELRPHHNEICLIRGSQLVRLIGFGRDDEDHSYIVQEPKDGAGDPVTWSSAAGRILPLKGHLPARDYVALASDLARRGCAATQAFLVEDRSIWDPEASSPYRLVSNCGRLILDLTPGKSEERHALWRAFPDRPEAKTTQILRGERVTLERIARSIISEMTDWEAGQASFPY